MYFDAMTLTFAVRLLDELAGKLYDRFLAVVRLWVWALDDHSHFSTGQFLMRDITVYSADNRYWRKVYEQNRNRVTVL